jgi:hypothetical protein
MSRHAHRLIVERIAFTNCDARIGGGLDDDEEFGFGFGDDYRNACLRCACPIRGG